jgi:uncharacterized protein YjiS (DUF1127 family)
LHQSKIDPRAALKQRAVPAFYLARTGMIDSILRRVRRRVAEQAIMQLDDHLLRDIGLTRAQLHAAARGNLSPDAPPEKDPSSAGAQRPSGAGRLALAALTCFALCSGSASATDDFARLPAVADLPAGTVKVSPPIPGMGEHWANPKDLPLGPIYCVMHGRVVCAEFMVSQTDFASGRSFERLRLGLDGKQPPINHLELNFQPHGHEGFVIPHYDLHMYFISPEARFSQRTAAP